MVYRLHTVCHDTLIIKLYMVHSKVELVLLYNWGNQAELGCNNIGILVKCKYYVRVDLRLMHS